MHIGERVINLEHAYNIREGWTRKDDTLPERFLKEIESQDTRATAKPIFVKLQMKHYVMADPRTAEYHAKAKDCEFLTEAPEDLGLDPDEDLAWNEVWKTEQVFFTYKGLAEHMELNGHNYRHETRDYVTHAFRNPEMVRVHQLIASLPKLLEALEVSRGALEHIRHGNPTLRHTAEWYGTAGDALAKMDKLLGEIKR